MNQAQEFQIITVVQLTRILCEKNLTEGHHKLRQQGNEKLRKRTRGNLRVQTGKIGIKVYKHPITSVL